MKAATRKYLTYLALCLGLHLTAGYSCGSRPDPGIGACNLDNHCDGDETADCPDCGCTALAASGYCGGIAASGCSCDPVCVTNGDCCPDAGICLPPTAQDAPISRRVLVALYNPVNPHYREPSDPSFDPGNPEHSWERVSDMLGMSSLDIDARSDEIVEAMTQSTGGVVNFDIVERRLLDDFPAMLLGRYPHVNGSHSEFQYDWDTFRQCRDDRSTCPVPSIVDGEVSYARILEVDLGGICGRIQSGEIDEIWLWGFDYFHFDEFAFKVPGDAVAYRSSDPWIYDLRKKDLPECGRTYFLMGFNPEVGLANALHSIGHRIESAVISSAPGLGEWGECYGSIGEDSASSEWSAFACTVPPSSYSGAGEPDWVSGCGDVHKPPNYAADYDYGNPRNVMSHCGYWKYNYPSPAGRIDLVSAATWGSTQGGYLRWWFDHIPRAAGQHDRGGVTILNNWWHYALCYDRPCGP